jgi:hypothetical protein
MPIMMRRAWFWGPHGEIEKPHLFHVIFLVNHHRIVMWELGTKGYIQKTDTWCEHAFWQVMDVYVTSQVHFSKFQPQTKWIPQAETRKLRNISHVQYTTKMLRNRSGEIQETNTSTYANAVKQDRRNPGDPHSRPEDSQMLLSRTGEIQETHTVGPRINHIPTYMYKQLQQHFQSTSTFISNNIYSSDHLIMVSTSTVHLLASQDINRLFRMCVYSGPVSSHISQPLVVSFDKTDTTPQTE